MTYIMSNKEIFEYIFKEQIKLGSTISEKNENKEETTVFNNYLEKGNQLLVFFELKSWTAGQDLIFESGGEFKSFQYPKEIDEFVEKYAFYEIRNPNIPVVIPKDKITVR